MKKLFFFSIISILFLYSCVKEDKLFNSNIEYRNIGVTNDSSTEVLDNIKVFSKALSRGLILYSDLRAFIKNKSVDETNTGYKELLLNCIKTEDIGSRITFEEKIDSLVFHFSNGKRSSEIINSILTQFPTFSINIPDKFINIDWDINDLGKTPAVVYYQPDTIINYNGEEIQTDYFTTENTIYYINLKVSENFYEVDLASGKINNKNLNINDFIGDLPDSCKLKVLNYFNTITENCKKYNNKVIFNIFELYSIINNCDQLNEEEEITINNPVPLCTTTPIRDVDNQHYTYNYFEGIELTNVSAADYMDNQPGGEKYFTFVFVWANAKDGGTQLHKRYYQIAKYDLFTPPTWEWIPDLSDCNDTDILSGNTDHCGYFELVNPAVIFHYSFNDNVAKHFFSLKDSRWYLYDVGKFFNLEIVEFDPETTSTTSGVTSTSEHKINIDIKVPIFAQYGGGNVGWEVKTIQKVSYSTIIKGASIVPLGQDPIDWCDQEEQFLDYPWGNLLQIRVGCDVLEY